MSEREIFNAAREMTDPLIRMAYLDAACGGDAALRARIEALLLAHDRPDSLLDRPAAVATADGGRTTVAVGDGDRDGTGATADEMALGFLEPATRPDSLGRIGHYEVLQVLGQGGFGIVFRAFDDVLQRVVAVKVLSPQMAVTSPARKRFLREARSSAQIRHENVVQVYEVGEQPLPYIAMEFIPGETLQERLNRTGPVDVPEVIRIGRQVAEGLAAAHARNLIHRDIKPGNILLEGGQLRVKITDFGLARAADDASISQSGLIAGTPMYMAPEQAMGEKLDQRADLFSLGSVLYVMASGRPPFRANGTVAVLKRVAEDTPRDIREIIPETPNWLCNLIAKLHAKDPADRYQSAREVADLLTDSEARLRDGGRQPVTAPPPHRPRRNRRRRWAAAILLLAAIGFAAVNFEDWTKRFGARPTPASAGPGGRPAPVAETVARKDPPPTAVAPFEADRARTHQEEWAEYLGVPVEFTDPEGLRFVLIPPGEFDLGTPAEAIERIIAEKYPKASQNYLWPWLRSEAPPRRVRIDAPFYASTRETTEKQFRRFAEASGYRTRAEIDGGWVYTPGEPIHRRSLDANWKAPAVVTSDDAPVRYVVPQDALAYCAWQTRNRRCNYTLPTESQWEFACRAGTTSAWSCGNRPEDIRRHAVTNMMMLAKPRPVGGLIPNPFGLHDIHGNIGELSLDTDGNAFKRGGAYVNEIEECRSAMRYPFTDDSPYQDVGFRVVITGDLRAAATQGTHAARGPTR